MNTLYALGKCYSDPDWDRRERSVRSLPDGAAESVTLYGAAWQLTVLHWTAGRYYFVLARKDEHLPQRGIIESLQLTDYPGPPADGDHIGRAGLANVRAAACSFLLSGEPDPSLHWIRAPS